MANIMQTRVQTQVCGCLCPAFASHASSTKRRAISSRPRPAQKQMARLERRVVVRAEQVQEAQPSTSSSPRNDDEGNWIPVCRPEDLPKGVRKEIEVDGQQVLLFWYRNEIFCTEARSPAEGAYSEGFIKAKFTQDYCIECPGTQSLFSLKDGSIKSWYPGNPVLRALTPESTCRPLEIYPIKLGEDAIFVDVTRGSQGGVRSARGSGGSDTSIENNNVFTVQPTVYFEGMDPTQESASVLQVGNKQEALNPATVTVGIVAVGIVAVAGTATCLYYENVIALGAFWVVLGGIVGVAAFNRVQANIKDAQK